MKNGKVSQLQPMSISVQSDDITSASTVSSTSKIVNPKDGVNKDNLADCAQQNAAEQNIRKTKTVQHLLSDWRTAYAISKKVILADVFFFILSYKFVFRKQLLGTQRLPVYLNHLHLGVNAIRKV